MGADTDALMRTPTYAGEVKTLSLMRWLRTLPRKKESAQSRGS